MPRKSANALNLLERGIVFTAPQWAERRMISRMRVQAMSGAYEATRPGRFRRGARDEGGGNAVALQGGVSLRNQARALERNHDLARGALDVLVRNIVGPTGIAIEPQPIGADGKLDEGLADRLHALWDDFCERPEVTWEMDFAQSQQLLARSWLRDGDVLTQQIIGPVRLLDHGSKVPFSLELIESDLLPYDLNDPARGIVMGVERNAWRRAVAYHVYKWHPNDIDNYALPPTKRVPAEFIRHLKMVDRIGQARGVSVFASVLGRLEDLKDYEESERIAAKIAASMAAVIKKGAPEDYPVDGYLDANGKPIAERQMYFNAGMIWDGLKPGESVETIDTKRPNPNVATHRDGQLRAAAAGMGGSYSSISKNYNGTYSAQRQELVEQYAAYALMSNIFTKTIVRPAFVSFCQAAVLSGQVRLPRGMDMAGLTRATYQPPTMPWIDPLKESEAYEIQDRNRYMSPQEIIRRRGANPRDVLRQASDWMRLLDEVGVSSPNYVQEPGHA